MSIFFFPFLKMNSLSCVPFFRVFKFWHKQANEKFGSFPLKRSAAKGGFNNSSELFKMEH